MKIKTFINAKDSIINIFLSKVNNPKIIYNSDNVIRISYDYNDNMDPRKSHWISEIPFCIKHIIDEFDFKEIRFDECIIDLVINKVEFYYKNKLVLTLSNSDKNYTIDGASWNLEEKYTNSDIYELGLGSGKNFVLGLKQHLEVYWKQFIQL